MRELFDLGLTGADSLRLPPCWPQLLVLWDKYMSAADVTLWVTFAAQSHWIAGSPPVPCMSPQGTGLIPRETLQMLRRPRQLPQQRQQPLMGQSGCTPAWAPAPWQWPIGTASRGKQSWHQASWGHLPAARAQASMPHQPVVVLGLPSSGASLYLQQPLVRRESL